MCIYVNKGYWLEHSFNTEEECAVTQIAEKETQVSEIAGINHYCWLKVGSSYLISSSK